MKQQFHSQAASLILVQAYRLEDDIQVIPYKSEYLLSVVQNFKKSMFFWSFYTREKQWYWLEKYLTKDKEND